MENSNGFLGTELAPFMTNIEMYFIFSNVIFQLYKKIPLGYQMMQDVKCQRVVQYIVLSEELKAVVTVVKACLLKLFLMGL